MMTLNQCQRRVNSAQNPILPQLVSPYSHLQPSAMVYNQPITYSCVFMCISDEMMGAEPSEIVCESVIYERISNSDRGMGPSGQYHFTCIYIIIQLLSTDISLSCIYCVCRY
jgi:hypothetical protein